MLEGDGYKTQITTNMPGETIIQAKNEGILRDIITADRAFTIMIGGYPNNFVIIIGIGKWIQNIAVVAIDTLLLMVLTSTRRSTKCAWHFGNVYYQKQSRQQVKA